MSQQMCLVCGFSVDEVEKMHYFLVHDQRSKKWQEMMGIKYVPGLLFRNYLICNRHFSESSYSNLVTRRLRTDAVPTLFPQQQLDSPQDMIIRETVIAVSMPSCSGLQKRLSIPTRLH